MNPITIVGGGLAGLTLGIALRQHDVPVTIIEAGRYPRHRVCGEFINGAGLDVLDELGLIDILRGVSVREARDAAFFVSALRIAQHPLPRAALCVSRYILDQTLGRHFQQMGGELREGERGRMASSPGIVWATGRRAHPTECGWRWFGLKVHARGVSLAADLEMHLGRNAYVGLCRLAQDEVNVCGLFRRKAREAAHGESLNWLRGEPGSRLFSRLETAEIDPESLCAVAGLSLRPEPIDEGECRIGDALTMIPPITGNGMSMAFESARIAVDPLMAYARGQRSWEAVTSEIAHSLRQTFARRLKWASHLHRLMFSPLGPSTIRLFFRSVPLWRASFAFTR